jgi:aryl-alcohol dehydrogenase-like predicted oxidoreductase
MAELERRRLGNTGMTPKALGLGCAWFGSDKSSDRDAVEGVRRAIELGIDFLDTSAGYGDSERRVGLALEGDWRDRVYLETKAGTHPQCRGDYSAKTIRWSVENSLRFLKTGYLDAVLIHDPEDIEVPLAPGHALDELLKMKGEGVIGHVGLGVRQHHFHRRAIETGHIEIVLTYLDYTLVDQSVARTTLPLARERGVGIILGSVLGMGLLGGREPNLEQPRPKAYLAHAMWQWCRDRGVDMRHLAIQFCMAARIDGIVMPGPYTKLQVEQTYEAATTEVPPEVWQAFFDEFGVAPERFGSGNTER